MKRLLYLLLIACVTIVARAETQRLVVWQRNGATAFFNLDEEPKTTFEDGKIVIKTSTTTVSYLLTDVLRYTYEGATITTVNEPAIRPGEMRYTQSKSKIMFDGMPAGTRLEVYSLDGKIITTLHAQEGRRTIVDLEGQPAGTYIVKAGEVTIKFLKR
ncbi:MAG: T9SS type A sorting domain-containing protein [Bacteroidaceae bacterium]|nr:T9SS type A sorting domain-containing protein [Bacteroidaceae bacterium]